MDPPGLSARVTEATLQGRPTRSARKEEVRMEDAPTSAIERTLKRRATRKSKGQMQLVFGAGLFFVALQACLNYRAAFQISNNNHSRSLSASALKSELVESKQALLDKGNGNNKSSSGHEIVRETKTLDATASWKETTKMMQQPWEETTAMEEEQQENEEARMQDPWEETTATEEEQQENEEQLEEETDTTTSSSDSSSHISPNDRQCRRVIASGKLPNVIARFAKFVPVNATSHDHAPPNHNHQTCFLMNPEQDNCAKKEDDPMGNDNMPTEDWKLILRAPSVSIRADGNGVERTELVCDLPAFVRDMGGPKGFAKSLNNKRNNPVYNVLLIGDSQLRQLWEALVCRWSEDITQIILQAQRQIPGHGTVKTLLKRTNLTDAEDHGCSEYDHNRNSVRVLSKESVPSAPTRPHNNKCNDDVSMVEFDHKIRFYYLHQPSLPNHLVHNATIALGLKRHKVDQLVFSQGNEKVLQELQWEKYFKPGVWSQQIRWNADDLFQGMRQRDIYDGASTNKFTGCGVPQDDEANVLLLMLLKYKVRTSTTLMPLPRLRRKSQSIFKKKKKATSSVRRMPLKQ